MKWLVAAVTALMVVSAQAKVLECRLPALKDPTKTLQKMQIEAAKNAVAVNHEMDYPNINIHRQGPRKVLYRNDTNILGAQFTLLVLEEATESHTFPPLLANVDWGKGTLRTSASTDDIWEQRWVCFRLD